MCAAPLTALLQEGQKDLMEILGLREKWVDRECQERKETLVTWAASVTLVLLDIVE